MMPNVKRLAIIFIALALLQITGQFASAEQPTVANARISMGYDGSQANGHSFNPTISNNGRFVVFTSDATNLVPGDTNGKLDVFVFDLQTEIMERVSTASNGLEGNAHSGFDNLSNISNDGRYVVFSSDATNLVENDTNVFCRVWENDSEKIINCEDVFVKDRLTNETRLVSVDSEGVQGNGLSGLPSISADGRYATFMSLADNLVENDNNNTYDIFIHDLQTGETKRVSIASDGTEANGASVINTISANGRYVVFETFASNLAPEDTDNQLGVYMHDLQTGDTLHISVGFPESIYNRLSLMPDVSADGRYISFVSGLNDGIGHNLNIYRRDRQAGTTEIVSVATDGHTGNKDSQWSSISDDGQWIAFTSEADNLVEAGGSVCAECENIYLKNMTTGELTLITKNSAGDYSSGMNFGTVFLSGDGNRLVFDSTSDGLVLNDTNGYKDIFVYGWKTTPVYSVNMPLVLK